MVVAKPGALEATEGAAGAVGLVAAKEAEASVADEKGGRAAATVALPNALLSKELVAAVATADGVAVTKMVVIRVTVAIPPSSEPDTATPEGSIGVAVVMTELPAGEPSARF